MQALLVYGSDLPARVDGVLLGCGKSPWDAAMDMLSRAADANVRVSDTIISRISALPATPFAGTCWVGLDIGARFLYR